MNVLQFPSQEWSPEKDQRLRELLGQGFSWPQIALALGRSEKKCKARNRLILQGLKRSKPAREDNKRKAKPNTQKSLKIETSKDRKSSRARSKEKVSLDPEGTSKKRVLKGERKLSD